MLYYFSVYIIGFGGSVKNGEFSKMSVCNVIHVDEYMACETILVVSSEL